MIKNDDASLKCNIKAKWEYLGELSLDDNELILFPDVDKVPAIYKFTFNNKSKESVYIGEAIDVRRRFRNYRKPSSKKTSSRINADIKNALKNKIKVCVHTITSGKYIIGKENISADLSSKTIRCLFENAAIIGHRNNKFDILNRAN